jgi:hypothetical protein
MMIITGIFAFALMLYVLTTAPMGMCPTAAIFFLVAAYCIHTWFFMSMSREESTDAWAAIFVILFFPFIIVLSLPWMLFESRKERKAREASAKKAKPGLRNRLRVFLDEHKGRYHYNALMACYAGRVSYAGVSGLLYDINDKELDKTFSRIRADYKRKCKRAGVQWDSVSYSRGDEETRNRIIDALERYYASMEE